MSGKMARNKGQNGEREVIKMLTPLVHKYYPDVKVQRELEQNRSGGHDIAGIPGFAVEVKRHETLQLKQWWGQTMRQAIAAQSRPVLIYRPNRKPWRVVISLYEMIPSAIGSDYAYTLNMSWEAFVIWFEARMCQDVEISGNNL